MNDATEQAIRLLTRLARGDVALVRRALIRHNDEGVERVITYIKEQVRLRDKADSAA